jgi:hypothetical protein
MTTDARMEAGEAMDREIAEKVMGLKNIRIDNVPGAGSLSGQTFPILMHGETKQTTEMVPRYSTDIAADYLVLEHVREKWELVQQNRFTKALNAILYERMWDKYQGKLGAGLSVYEPGDYSRAALSSLTPRA